MSIKYVLLATEGPHDQAAVGKFLKLCGLKDFKEEFRGESKFLDPFWTGFVPTYPKRGKLYERMDMPSIFTSSTHSVAVYQGGGSDLTKNLIAIITAYPQYAQSIYAFGLIVDADAKQPSLIAKRYAQDLRQLLPSIADAPGVITTGTPQTGIYVLPNNKELGVLDTVLVNCSSVVYPEHKVGAELFLKGLSNSNMSHWKPFDRQKAVVASIVSVLKPGMANTPSIAQDNWISEQTVNNIAEVAMLKQFIEDLLELSSVEGD